MENTIEMDCGSWGLPWGGWEEENFMNCSPLLLAEDEFNDLQVAGAHIKAEVIDVGVDGFLNFTIDNTITGEFNEVVQSWMDPGEEIDLPDLFDSDGPLNFPFQPSMEKDPTNFLLSETLLEPLSENTAGFVLDGMIVELFNSGDENTCLSTVDEEIPFDSSSHDVGSVEDSMASSSDISHPGSAEDDSSDWEWERKEKTYKKRKCSRSGESYRKSTKKDPMLRKKEQNKNAATRYREKKRVEELERQAVCELLETRNKELRKEVEEKEQEVKVLRQLLVDILRPS